MTAAVASLRERARSYELSSLAAQERQDADSERLFTLLAITLFEVAEALDEDANEEDGL